MALYFYVAMAMCLLPKPSLSMDLKKNTSSESQNSGFSMVFPEKGYMTFYDFPPTPQYAQLLIRDKTTVDPVIEVHSLKPDISLIIQDSVTVEKCVSPIQTEVKVENSSEPMVVAPYRIHQNWTDSENASCYNISFSTTGEWFGFSTLNFVMISKAADGGREETDLGSALLIVAQMFRPVDFVFVILIRVLVGVATFGMGNDMSFEIIKKHMKRPKAPILALVCQYTIMPLLAFAIIHMMSYRGGKAMGLFLLGASPGGGTSNMFSKLLNGDMTMSVTMTTLSTVASLAMIPFWVYTLGTAVPANEEIGEMKIPFVDILISLLIIVVPIALGYLVRRKLPRFSAIIRKCLKVFFILLIAFAFSVGIYANLFVFKAFDVKLVFAAMLLPYGGFLLGGLIAWLFKLEWKLVKTISLETGMQNVGVPIMVLQTALLPPDSSLAMIAPVAAAIMTMMPLYVITPAYMFYQWWTTKRNASNRADQPESVTGTPEEKLHMNAPIPPIDDADDDKEPTLPAAPQHLPNA